MISTLSCAGAETYADQHLATIQYDCQQTAACDPVFTVRADALSECVEDTSTKLNTGSDAFRAAYEQRFSRCAGTTGCDYYNCAGDTMLFSIVNEAALRNECQQNVICKIQQQQPSAPNDADLCFQQLAQMLDFATIPNKASWTQRVQRCTGQQGCAYVQCK